MKENEVILEDKIREALPRLKELTKGCKIYDKESMFPYEIVDNRYYPQLYCYEYSSFRVLEFNDLGNFETIGHPIKLNDVLQYLTFLGFPLNSYQYKEVLKLWFLDSVFLADQSDELKEFLNKL